MILLHFFPECIQNTKRKFMKLSRWKAQVYDTFEQVFSRNFVYNEFTWLRKLESIFSEHCKCQSRAIFQKLLTLEIELFLQDHCLLRNLLFPQKLAAWTPFHDDFFAMFLVGCFGANFYKWMTHNFTEKFFNSSEITLWL